MRTSELNSNSNYIFVFIKRFYIGLNKKTEFDKRVGKVHLRQTLLRYHWIFHLKI